MKDLHLIIEECFMSFYESLMNFLRMLGFSPVVRFWSLHRCFKILLFQNGTRRKIENNKKPFKFQRIKP